MTPAHEMNPTQRPAADRPKRDVENVLAEKKRQS
jgi:hypothetical protein